MARTAARRRGLGMSGMSGAPSASTSSRTSSRLSTRPSNSTGISLVSQLTIPGVASSVFARNTSAS
ncbi:hypothetical protein CYLTODRAFT_426805 [Cylindrobasidium torrendii FP15055 ss-10]|uniref:Uncharacterized protein n=1 Tax=Cylindrobasidium torrendii FP15055 ss-10 TaxID=1314674 RepID=A0A0D7AZ69_9AGAR|nr:hypothetical protein CYLTODRAFT_426805 [Cylindrobasidium torrendii FP15055 ss-10]